MKWLTWNNMLKVVATVVGVAGTIVAAPAAVVPAVVGGIALKVVTYGTLAGVLAGYLHPSPSQAASPPVA